MTLTYRAVKGTALTHTELDGNFTDLDTKITSLIDSAPGVLDTLNELAAAINDDPAFFTTITTSIATREPTVIAGTTAQYYRGDKTWQTLTTSAGEASFSIQSASFNVTAGLRYGVKTTVAAVTATLPASPSAGDAVFFADAGGAYATNSLTIGRNGNTIMGSATDMTVSTNNQAVGVFYTGSDWRIY